jgi:hypothetical protein
VSDNQFLLGAIVAGAMAAALVLAAGLVIALVTPDASILGRVGADAGIGAEAFRQAVGTLLTPMVDPGLIFGGPRRTHPLLLLLVPLAALALATRRRQPLEEGAAPMAWLAWALAVAVPFALLMLAFAVLGGETETTRIAPSAGAAFALGLLWGVLGALIGAAGRLWPSAPRRVVAASLATLRPLAVVVAICTVLGLAGWLVQVAAGVDDVRAGRSTATALIEEAAFAGEHGVHLTVLAAGARFRADANRAVGLPFPVEKANEVTASGGAFRIFAYDGQLPGSVFVPAVVLLIALVALGALYAGFAAARTARAATRPAAVAWGALAGPVWAIAMAVLVVLAGGVFHGDADDVSVLGVFLFGGALLGAAGGALAAGRQCSGSPVSSSS